MLELVKVYHKRLTETVLVISISVCSNSTVSMGTLQGLQEMFGLSRTVFVLSGLHCTLFTECFLIVSLEHTCSQFLEYYRKRVYTNKVPEPKFKLMASKILIS